MSQIVTDICIVGGGPAGVMLGFILAKLGVEVVVLEKATHYQRTFRGEYVSPDTEAVHFIAFKLDLGK